jgi:hypothetical protein
MLVNKDIAFDNAIVTGKFFETKYMRYLEYSLTCEGSVLERKSSY